MSNLRLVTIAVDGMTCSSCSGTVENALKCVNGVQLANVNLTTNTATASYYGEIVTAKALVAEIESVGFDAEILIDEEATKASVSEDSNTRNPIHTKELGESSYRLLLLGIEGMTCSSCSGTVENALRSVPGVQVSTVVVALSTNTATLQYNPAQVQATQIINEVEDVGFGAEVLQDDLCVEQDIEKGVSSSSLAVNGNSLNFLVDSGVIKTVLLLVEHAPLSGISQSESGADADFVRESDSSSHGLRQRSASASSESVASDGVAEELLSELSQELESLYGVTSVEVRESDAQIKVTFDDFLVGPRDFSRLCTARGLTCTVSSLGGFMMANRLLKSQAKEAAKLYAQLVLAASLTAPIFCITMVLGMIPFFHKFLAVEIFPGLAVNGALLFVLSFPVQFYVGNQFHAKAWKSLKTGTLGMDFLVSTGTMAAYLYSTAGLVMGIISGVPNMRDVEYFETSAVLITAVLLGKYLEVYAKGQTAAAIHKLSKLKAHSARLVRSGTAAAAAAATSPIADPDMGADGTSGEEQEEEEEAVIDAALLHRRDVVRLVAGETVPADGELLAGGGVGVDEAMMTVSFFVYFYPCCVCYCIVRSLSLILCSCYSLATFFDTIYQGESALVAKIERDKVFGGTMVIEGSALMRVSACGEDSTLGKIISTVQQAQVLTINCLFCCHCI